MVVVVKVFSLDRLQQRLVEQNTLTFQFRDVLRQAVEVLKVYTQDRVQQRLMPSKSLTFLFLPVEVLNSLILTFAPDELDQGFF